jgi:ribonuclease HI
MIVHLFTDGGSRGNPGPAACGYVILDTQGKVIEQKGTYVGEATNNYAEYQGLLHGLERCKKLGASSVSCFLDSELVVKQMTGEYRVKHPDLRPLWEQARSYFIHFQSLTFTAIRREKNKEADRMVNEALDSSEE